MDLLQVMENSRFVGEEYLTWLWFRTEIQDGLFQFDEKPLEVFFHDQLTLEARLAETEQNRLVGGSPSDSAEAHEALRRGKRVSKTKLKIVKEGREWIVTVTAQTLALSGIKIPAVLSQEEDDKFYERMYLIEELEAVLRDLYKQFLDIRLHLDAWPKELQLIQSWIAKPAPALHRD